MREGSPSPVTTWTRNPEIVWRETFGEVLLLCDADQQNPLALHGATALLWSLLDEPLSVDACIGLLAQAAGRHVSLPQRSDVEAALSQLHALDLVRADG